MSRDISDLIPEFKEQVQYMLKLCNVVGVEMRPYSTLRSPWKQARIWRSTRSTEEILRAEGRLKSLGAFYIARILMDVGPQRSDPGANGHLTHALPGSSWHQWGEAIDCFWVYKGEAVWSTDRIAQVDGGFGVNGYHVYGEKATEAELTSGGVEWGWDWPHVQFQPNSPLESVTWGEIDEVMQERFSQQEPS